MIDAQLVIIAYSVYLPVALLMTFFVARSLFQNSEIFMMDIFHGRHEIAMATNKLFRIGFYLLNVGFALLILRIEEGMNHSSFQHLIEVLSYKIGGFSVYLGAMVFVNLYLLFRGKKKSKLSASIPKNQVFTGK